MNEVIKVPIIIFSRKKKFKGKMKTMSLEKHIQGFEPSVVHRVVNQAPYSEGGLMGREAPTLSLAAQHPEWTICTLQMPRATQDFLLTPATIGKGFQALPLYLLGNSFPVVVG